MITANASGCASAVCKKTIIFRITHHAAAALCAACVLGANIVLAQNLNTVVRFDIKSQPLHTALLEFGRQAHMQIMFASKGDLARLNARPLNGRYTVEQGLTDLLSGTGVVFVEHGRTLDILPSVSVRAGTRNHSTSHPDPAPNRHAGEEGKVWVGRRKSSKTRSKGKRSRRHNESLGAVIITGSRIPTTSKYGPQEVHVYDRRTIVNSGQNTVTDFLSTLPSVSLTQKFYTNLPGNAPTVQLRGLPVGTTLVLLNGRRLENSGATDGEYFDLSLIPLAAVQRIEVDENGSSAVYGSDAIAGVVNIILKKRFHGLAANAQYDWAKDVRNIHASVAVGKAWRRGGISVIGSYETDSGYLNSARLLSSTGNYTAFGGPDSNFPVCSRANVYSLNNTALPGAPPGSAATYAAVTGDTVSGKPSLSQFTYGSLNTCDLFENGANAPPTEIGSVFAHGYLRLNKRITVFTELLYSHKTWTFNAGPQFLFGEPGYQQFTVSAANPFNPFGEQVGISQAIYGAPIIFNTATAFFRPLVGAKGSIWKSWRWELAAWQSTDRSHIVNDNYFGNITAIDAALNSSDPATALNPFVAGALASPQLLHSLFSTLKMTTTGRERSIQGWLRGSLARLPAGRLQAVIGGEFDSIEYFDHYISGAPAVATLPAPPNFNYGRREYAIFGEAKLPLFRQSNTRRSLMNLTVSGRYDHYNDFGGKITDQFGVAIRPVRGLLITGTYGTAFAAPQLGQENAPQTISEEPIFDPVTNTTYPVQFINGGNPSLKPETGESHAVGIAYTPREVHGLRASATQWTVRETNVAEQLPAGVFLYNPGLFPGRVIRNSAGQLVTINDTFANFGSIDVAGIDYSLHYLRHFRQGTGSLALDATETYHYREALTPGAPVLNALGVAQNDGQWAPRWKGVAALNWSEGSIAAHFDARYVGPYLDYAFPGYKTRKIGNFWTMDANIHLSVGSWFGRLQHLGARSDVTIGATNLFNRSPQFSNYLYGGVGYDPSQTEIVGRVLYVNVGVHW